MILINVDTIMNISIVNISNFYQKSMEIHTDYYDLNILLGVEDQIVYNYFLYFTGNQNIPSNFILLDIFKI